MTKILTTRAPDALVREIEAMAREEHLDKSTLIRRLLAEAIEDKRKQKALELYREKKVSMGKAASLAKVTDWEMLDLVREKGLHIDYGSEELFEDLEPLRRKSSASRK